MMHCHSNYESAAKQIINKIGNTIVIGVPLGIGKPIGLLNALYTLAAADESIKLTIITGLTLSRPSFSNDLEERLVSPIMDRLLKNYNDPLYEKARELQELPSNINVIEFFLSPGKFLHNNYVQQNYISSAYTNVARDTIYRSINVLSQQVACSDLYPDNYSLSCNADLFYEVKEHLDTLKQQGQAVAIVAEVNRNLPFLFGEKAVFHAGTFTDIIDAHDDKSLFAIPREEISIPDHLIGLYTSCLIKDGGCLQIGIGKLSNAVANALIFRHKNNELYCSLIEKLAIFKKFNTELTVGELDIFKEGLNASTEMLSDEYMQLYKENILKKRVYDHIGLQKLLNAKKISETIDANTLDTLIENKIIQNNLTQEDVVFLTQFGIFKSDIIYKEGVLILSQDKKIPANLALHKQFIIDHCLGEKLLTGKIIHAGFFLGSEDFYQTLHNLTLPELQQIEMSPVSRTNTLMWNHELAILQRHHARFVNSAMMVTLGGVVISDGLENLQEVSGVGGQFDFVLMANQLSDARSIINFRSTRTTKKGIESTIVWDYSNITIPRFLRDIVITEYGIADCRSKTDSEVIQAMLNIADSRFQPELLAQAKKCGKIPLSYEIPDCYKKNLPSNIEPIMLKLQANGYFKPYPFGSDLTETELLLAKALLYLQKTSTLKRIGILFLSFFVNTSPGLFNNHLLRLQRLNPKNIKEYLEKKLLLIALKKVQ
jgi:acyl-CoA hydrolase